MELWLIYAIIASISIGINGYLIKVLADRNINGGIVTFMQGMTYFFLGLGQSLILGWDIFSYNHIGIIWLSILMGIIIFLNLRIRIRVLKYLSASEYFIGYRILTTIALVVVGIIFLAEDISLSQIFGLILGSFAIIFLFEEDIKLRNSRNWKNAMMYLFLSIVAGGTIQVISKIQGLGGFPYSSMFFYQGISMLVISLLFDSKVIIRDFTAIKEHKKTLLLTLLATVCVYIAAVYNILAYTAGGSVSIVTKIMAYSLFVSIGLSMLLGKEKMTYKKGIAFVLTILSIYYLN